MSARLRPSRDICMKMSRSSWTVRFDVSMMRSAIDRIWSSFLRSSVMPSLTDRSRASGCGRRVSLNRRTSVEWLASRKISVGFSVGAARSFLKTRGKWARKSFSRTSTCVA